MAGAGGSFVRGPHLQMPLLQLSSFFLHPAPVTLPAESGCFLESFRSLSDLPSPLKMGPRRGADVGVGNPLAKKPRAQAARNARILAVRYGETLLYGSAQADSPTEHLGYCYSMRVSHRCV
ncbi:hypothetical protein BDW71DRAFT_167326 [Aspergillus fruticulosus]